MPIQSVSSIRILYAPNFLTETGRKQFEARIASNKTNLTLIDINKNTVSRASRNAVFQTQATIRKCSKDEAKQIKSLEKSFIDDFLQHETFGFKDMCAKNMIGGISLVPFTENFMFLGKENDGIYKGLYNFFGGKTDDKVGNGRKLTAEQVASVMFQETYEEMGFILDAGELIKSMIGIVMVPIPNSSKVSMLVLFNIINFDNVIWKSIMVSRVACEHKYYEMTEVTAVDMDILKKVGIKKSNILSTYVKSAADAVITYRDAHSNPYSMNFLKVHTVRIDEQGLPSRVSPVNGGKKK